MERQAASSAGAQRGSGRIASDDGVVTFQLKRCAEGVVMERTRNRLGPGQVCQAMQFRDEAGFIRWCESDPLRFAYPLLFANLRRSGCALFHSAA
jgi:hypothetical protein